jgi:hypothetical protein
MKSRVETQHPKLNRAQRRLMKKLADRIDLIAEADRQYFERFPHRKHRVRVAGRAEIEQAKLTGADMSLPPGKQNYSVVRYLTPDTCLRMSVVGPVDADPELFSEEEARGIFERNETDEVRMIQEDLLKMAGVLK